MPVFLVVSLARAQQLLAFEGDVTDFVFSIEDSKRPKPGRCWCRVKKRVRTRRLRKSGKHGTNKAYLHACHMSTFGLARQNC